MKKINFIISIIVVIGIFLLMPSAFLAEDTNSSQKQKPDIKLYSIAASGEDRIQDQELSEQDLQYTKDYIFHKKLQEQKKLKDPLTPEQLKEKLKYEIIQNLRRLYDYKPGIITIKFKDRRIPDRMVLKDGEIRTGDNGLDSLLEEYGFNDFQVIGAKINREKLDLRIYKYAYCYSPVLEKQAKAFLRATHHKIDKLMKDFEIELYQGEDRPYSEILGLNMQRAGEYLDDKEISFKLWDKQITFKYKDRIKDPFSLEIIERLKSQPAIENAYIAPKYYPTTDYYAENNMWNLNYSPEGSYPIIIEGSITWVLYTLNSKYDEDIDAHVVWNNPALYDPSDGGISFGSGEPVVVAVIDSGIDFGHPEFIETNSWGFPTASRVWINTLEDIDNDGFFTSADIDSIDNDNNGYIDDVSGFNFWGSEILPNGKWTNTSYIFPFPAGQPSVMPYDDDGHGTNMAGIIGAANDNNGIKGIAYNSKILPIKILNSQGNTEPNYNTEADSLNYAIALKQESVNIVVANLSINGYEYDAAFSDAVIDATNAGITVVKSTGNGDNSGYNAYNIAELQPSGYYCLDRDATDAAIMVGSSNFFGNVSGFSDYGEGIVDVVAPGEYIITARAAYSLYPEWQIIDENGFFDLTPGGTSLSAPHTSGLAALIAANYPALTPAQIQQKIKDTAELLYDDLGNPIGSDRQGYGKINMSGIPAPDAPEFTSTPPTEAEAGLTWEYQAQATGVIDPWFDWPNGYTPPGGMQLDKGIGLITWTPDYSQIGEEFQVRLQAKNLLAGQEDEQDFDVAVIFSTDPNAYLRPPPYVGVGDLQAGSGYYLDTESYILPITITSPLVEIPSEAPSEPGSEPGFYVYYGNCGPTPLFLWGIKVNGIPLLGNAYWDNSWPPIPAGAYPTMFALWNSWDLDMWLEPWSIYPTGGCQPSFGNNLNSDIQYLEENGYGLPCLTHRDTPGGCYAAFGSTFGTVTHELLFANPPAIAQIYGYDWDITLYYEYGAVVEGHDHYAIPIYEYNDYLKYCVYLESFCTFDGSLLDGEGESGLATIHWTPQDLFPGITIRAEGTIYYTNNKTGQAEPLRNVKLQLSGVYSSGGPIPSQYVWTNENGYFDFGEVTYPAGYTPRLYIWAQCRDDDNGNPLVATIVKQLLPEIIILTSGEFYLTESPMNIDLVQGGSFNTEANILMEIRKTHNFLMNNLELSHGLFNPEPDNPEPAPLILRDNIFCKWIGGNGNSYYSRYPDELIIFQGDPNGPLGSDPSWYEIRHNYALSVLQWHFEEKGIYEIECISGVQSFIEDLSWKTAFLWGFADLVALRTDGESQINIDYSGESYDIENTDFENYELISQPTLSEGVCAGIFLDMVDANPDVLTDELNGSMYSLPGPNSYFNYIFQNMINTALTSVALPNHEFNLIDFSWNWNNYQYPEVNKVWGIYLGHGIVLPEIENP